jgi:dephospho-CoA kinase
MICGEFGTGKTLLITIASKEVGHGIIYVDVPANIKDFGTAFGEALNFSFEEDITLTRQLIRKICGGTNGEVYYHCISITINIFDPNFF